VDRLGERPKTLTPASYQAGTGGALSGVTLKKYAPETKKLVGIDVYLESDIKGGEAMAARIQPLVGDGLELARVFNRGQQVWPEGIGETFCTDHWRCRIMGKGGGAVKPGQLAELLSRLAGAGLDVVQTASLYEFDGKPGFSVATAG
jgi:isocitrate dehydrogenase